MCMLAIALNPAAKVTGWDCSAGTPAPDEVCTWGGVTCTSNDVTGINLSKLGLSGTIPSSIGDITSIQSLMIANNNIVGTVPSTISNLLGLTNINLSGNKLTGVLPSSLCQVPTHSLGSSTVCGKNFILLFYS